jgi:hypothetical protein
MHQGHLPRCSEKKDRSPHILHLESLHMLALERILLTLKHTIKQIQQSPDLELRLKSYGRKKFCGLKYEFGKF